MFFHNFKYTMKALFKNKALVFWTFAFPLILGLFFNMAFSNIESGEVLDIVNIAVVQNEELENKASFKQAIDYLSDEKNNNRLFSTQYVSEEEATKLLEDGKIDGFVKLTEKNPTVVIDKNGVNQTVLKQAIEEVYQSEDSYEKIVEKIEAIFDKNNNESMITKIMSAMSVMNKSSANIRDTSKTKLSYSVVEYYTLIAMACMYGGIIGAVAISWMLANMTNIGKRTAVSAASKIKMLLSTCLASYVVQMVGIAILFAFLVLVLKVDFGTRLPQIILLAAAGCLAGLSLGLAVSTLIKSGEGKKTGIILAITMTGCFLSGMMGVQIKYTVDKSLPILNKINPSNMITDGFYALYYYEKLNRYYMDLASLAIFSAIMLAISIITLRRQKYDSI